MPVELAAAESDAATVQTIAVRCFLLWHGPSLLSFLAAQSETNQTKYIDWI